MALLSLFLFCWASAKSKNGCPNLIFEASGKAGPLPDRSSTPWLNAGTSKPVSHEYDDFDHDFNAQPLLP